MSNKNPAPETFVDFSPKVKEGGIYAILNQSNGKIYIGSAVCFSRRFSTHVHYFNRGTQENQYLQRAFNKSPESFKLFIVEELKDLSKQNILSKEQFWMNFYKSYIPENGYNLSPTAGSCRGIKMSDETKKALSKKLMGRKLSPEHCLKISAALRRRIRKPLTEEQKNRIKIGLAKSEIKKNPEDLKKGSKKRQEMKVRWRPVVQLDSCGNEIQRFDSIIGAAKSIGSLGSKFNIGAVCRGERQKAKGYGWKYG